VPAPAVALAPELDPAPALDRNPALAAPTEPALTEQIQQWRRSAQESVLGRDGPPGRYALRYAPQSAAGPSDPATSDGELPEHPSDGVTESPAELASTPRLRDARHGTPPPLGHFVGIEPESALDSFHRALARFAAGDSDEGKVRILAYGASHTQADIYTGYLRAYLQRRFGDGGQGFVLLGRVNHWYRTLDTRAFHRALTVYHAPLVPELEPAPLGLFGAAFEGRGPDAYGEIVTAKGSGNTRFEVHYLEQPNGGDFDLQVDGATVARIGTSAESPAPAHHSFEAGPGKHRIRARLRGDRLVRLFGIVAETAAPGVVVDTLGIGGARMSGMLRWDEHTWAEALHHRKPDLVLFAYGTNEASDRDLSLPRYESGLRASLARLRTAAPAVSCVLIGPFDLVDRNRARLLKVIDAQRRISREFGCGFWNGYAFMGGEHSMQRWVSAKPPLASPDHIHLTRLGYVYAGIAIGDALMRAYDQSRGLEPSLAAPEPAPERASASPDGTAIATDSPLEPPAVVPRATVRSVGRH